MTTNSARLSQGLGTVMVPEESDCKPRAWLEGSKAVIFTNIKLDGATSMRGLRDLAAMREHVRVAVDGAPGDVPLWMWLPSGELWVCSALSPTWEDIPGAVSASSRRMIQFEAGARVRWKTVVAPRKTIRVPGKRSVKQAMPKEGVEPWLLSRLDGCLSSVRVSRLESFRLEASPASWFASGHGVVEDGRALADLVCQGVGPSKNLGNGLMVVEAARVAMSENT